MTVKVTAIVNAKGELIAAQEAQLRGEHDAGLLAGPGQTLHELDVPEDVLKITDPVHFHDTVVGHLHTHLGKEAKEEG
jgi:hypothetical protein